MNIYETGRYYPDFPLTLAKKREANWPTILKVGLQAYFDSNEAVDIGEKSGYHISTWPPTSLCDPYNLLLYAMPKIRKPIVSTFDQLPADASKLLLESAFMSVNAIRKTALANKDQANTILVTQHVGPDDINSYPFTTTLPQIHLHIHPLEEKNLQTHNHLFQQTSTTNTDYKKYLFHDPFFKLIFELISHKQKTTKVHRTDSSLELFNKPIDDPLTDQEVYSISEFFSYWEEWNKKISSCYTDFTLDENGRYVVLPREAIQKRLEDMILNNNQMFSKRSKRILNFLVDNIKDSKQVNPWQFFYKGISGCAGYIFDYNKKVRSFIIAPRIRVVDKKNWLLSENPSHIVIKNRTRSLKDEAITHQQRIYLQLNQSLNEQLKTHK